MWCVRHCATLLSEMAALSFKRRRRLIPHCKEQSTVRVHKITGPATEIVRKMGAVQYRGAAARSAYCPRCASYVGGIGMYI
jgi:hypothetical protein